MADLFGYPNDAERLSLRIEEIKAELKAERAVLAERSQEVSEMWRTLRAYEDAKTIIHGEIRMTHRVRRTEADAEWGGHGFVMVNLARRADRVPLYGKLMHLARVYGSLADECKDLAVLKREAQGRVNALARHLKAAQAKHDRLVPPR